MKYEIKKFFKGEVEDGRETLENYSRDASIFVVRPKLVLYPKDSEDVQNLVKWVSENCARQDLTQKYGKLSITPRCAGTDMSGGAIGESLILDFTRHMNKLVRGPELLENFSGFLQPSAGTFPVQNSPGVPVVTVQPGMFYRDFEKITLRHGLILPCYTASKSINAMGGMFGNNSAGERTLQYGKTENYVVESKIVFADGVERVVGPVLLGEISAQGEIYKKVYELIKKNEAEIKHAKPKVRKNSAGYYIWNVLQQRSDSKNFSTLLQPSAGTFYLQNSSNPIFDLNKLLVGSQGTLGIVTEITFRLVQEPKYSKLVVVFLNDLEPLGRLVDEILTLRPETLESYDNKTLELALRFFPDFLRNRGLWSMARMLWSFLPEFGMMLWGGFPRLILLVGFAGEGGEEVQKKCEQLVAKIENFKLKVYVTKSEAESNKYWGIRRESFAMLRAHVAGRRTAPFIDDIIVRPEFLPKFLPELDRILEQYDLIYTIAGHAGDGNFHIIPLMDFSRGDTAKIILELSDKVYDLVLRYQGSITAEHNDGIVRTPYLEKMYGPHMMAIFREIKNIFDPHNILNPGKKIALPGGAGTKDYLAAHIALEHESEHLS